MFRFKYSMRPESRGCRGPHHRDAGTAEVDVVLQRDILEGAREGADAHLVGHAIGGENRMEPGEALIRKREPGMVVMNGRVQQNLGTWSEVGERGLLVEAVVEDLHHDIGAGEVGEPIAEDVMRQEPPPDPTALKIVAHRFANRCLCKGAGLVAQSVIHGRQCPSGHAGDHIDLVEQTSLLEFQHGRGAEVGRPASTSGNGQGDEDHLSVQIAHFLSPLCRAPVRRQPGLFHPAPVAWRMCTGDRYQQA